MDSSFCSLYSLKLVFYKISSISSCLFKMNCSFIDPKLWKLCKLSFKKTYLIVKAYQFSGTCLNVCLPMIFLLLLLTKLHVQYSVLHFQYVEFYRLYRILYFKYRTYRICKNNVTWAPTVSLYSWKVWSNQLVKVTFALKQWKYIIRTKAETV